MSRKHKVLGKGMSEIDRHHDVDELGHDGGDLEKFLDEHPNVKVKKQFGAGTRLVAGLPKEYVPREFKAGVVPLEAEEQEAYADWMAKCMPGVAWFHPPNGGHRGKREAAAFQRQGVKPGIPDIIIMEARGIYHGAAIELKRRKGGELSDTQKLWRDILVARGFFWGRADGFDEAKRITLEYLAKRIIQ